VGWKLRVFSLAFLLAAGSTANCATQGPDVSLLQGLKWRLVGPFRGGRVEAVAGIEGDSRTYYFGAVSGGVWKTTDGGTTWKPLFDKQSTQAIGAIAIAPSDPNTIYVGTGEPSLRNDITYGNGMYKSTDGGSTWKHIGLEDTQHISKVIVDPKNPKSVLVAALGHASGPNSERGVFKTEDGGATWKKVLYKDDRTGVIDLCVDPGNPHILFAAMYQISRAPWALNAGGQGSGLYKSTDGGDTWSHIEGHGLPNGPLGRIGVAVAANSKRVYALIEAKTEGGMYRSDDGGENWTLLNGDHNLSQRPWYFSQIFADPANPDKVYSLAYRMLGSIDGGRTFQTIPGSHGDHHALWIDPSNGSRMIEGNDGGATITLDGGGSWTPETNQPTGQFYHVVADNRFMYRIYGSQQDSGSVSVATRTDHGAIDNSDWYSVAGGESGYIAPDPLDQNTVFGASYAGELTKWDGLTGEAQMISPWPQFMDGLSASQVQHRFNWTSPVVFSPNEPHALYSGGEVVFKTVNNGMSWTAISPDLTRNDKTKQVSSGGPVSNDNAGTEYYDTVFTIAESPLKPGLIWAGSDDGLIHLTTDGGKNWANVTPAGMPEWTRVDLIEASPHSPGVAYAAVDRHLLDDIRPYIYRTDNYGKSWTQISKGIPDTAYVHAVREDPKRQGLLFAGTEQGVYVSFNNGDDWQSLQMNLPRAPAYDLIVKRDDLVVATHGRSFWILDNIEPLRQLQDQSADEAVHLFQPPVVYRAHFGSGEEEGGNPGGEQAGAVVGANPPDGAPIDYYLKAAVATPISITITDSKGHVVRTFRSAAESIPPLKNLPGSSTLPAARGLNRFVWDLRLDPPTGIPAAIYQEGSHLQGVFVLPGEYVVKLSAEGKTLTVPLQVKMSPDVKTSAEDLQRQFDLATKINNRISEAHETVSYIRSVHKEIEELENRKLDPANREQVLAAAKGLDRDALAVEDALYQMNKTGEKDSFNYGGRLNDMLIGLEAAVERADTAPTQQMYDVFNYLDHELQVQLQQKDKITNVEIPAMNKLLHEGNVPFIEVSQVVSGTQNK
jgi:photosystem II stability/assembly factor-like uncharacterized protein